MTDIKSNSRVPDLYTARGLKHWEIIKVNIKDEICITSPSPMWKHYNHVIKLVLKQREVTKI
jgi:hypothetical protein